MAKKKSKASYRRGLIDSAINNAQNRIQQEQKAAQEAAKAQIPSYAKGMSLDDVNKIIDSYSSQNTIPTLEQNTTPTTPTTPSIADELERMKKAKADTTTPRTEGEQKAIDTYYDSLMKVSGSAPKQSTPTTDYRAEIDRMNALKADTSAPRTEGENQAIDTYLNSLEEAQRYVDSQKPRKSKKIGTVEVKADGTKTYTKSMSKSEQKNFENDVRRQALIEQGKEIGKQTLEAAKAGKIKSTQALSANEQRDVERAVEAVKGAQAKAVGKWAKENAVPRERVLSPNEQRDLERAQNAIAKAKEKEKVTTETGSVAMPTTANVNNTDQLTYGQIQQEKDISQDYDERGFKKTSAVINEYLDPNKKLSKSEEQYAWKLINDYENSELGQKNENATTLVFDNAHPDGISVPDYTVVYDEKGIPRYDPSKELTPEEREYGQKIGYLKTKVMDSESSLVGTMQTIPFVDAAMKAGDTDGTYAQMVANAQKQNPIAYYTGLLGGGIASNLAGQFLLGGTQYADKLAKVSNKLLGKGTLASQIATDALVDAPVDFLTDILPTYLADKASGKKGKDLTLSTLGNVALNGGLNLGGALVGNAGDIVNSLKKQSVLDDSLKQLEGADLFAKMAENKRIANVEPEGLDYFAEMASDKRSQEAVEHEVRELADAIKTALEQDEAMNPLEAAAKNADEAVGQGVKNADNLPKNASESVVDDITEKIADAETNKIDDAVKQADEVVEEAPKNLPLEEDEVRRLNQNAQEVSQKVEPKPLTQADNIDKYDLAHAVDTMEMSDETRSVVGEKLGALEKAINNFNKSKTKKQIINAMNEFEKAYSEIETALRGNSEIVETIDTGLKEERNALANALKGRVINISKISRGELPDRTMRDLNNILYSGHGSGRFVMKGGTPIDTVFNEIDQQTGGALTRYMVQNGLDPDVTESQAKGIIDYALSLKGDTTQVHKQAYEGGMFDPLFEDMIRRASERGLDIDENALRNKQFVSAFRTNKQGNFGMTDEELNNEYFNTQNKNFHILKGDRGKDLENATKHLTEDYDGTVKNIIDSSTDKIFTPQEVDEAMMAWTKELNKGRETGDYTKAAEIMYKLTQNRSKTASSLQATAAWKKNSPAGVVMAANQTVHDLAVDKTSKGLVGNLDNAVDKGAKIINEGISGDLSYDEAAAQLKKIWNDTNKKGYRQKLNGYEQMLELMKTGKEYRFMVYEDLHKNGKYVTAEQFEQMLKDNRFRNVIEEDLHRYGKQVTVEDFNEMLKTGYETSERILEDLNKAGKQITREDWFDMLKTGVLYRDIEEDLQKVGSSVTMQDFNNMLLTGKNVDTVTVKDLLYGANKLPNLDANAQKELLDIAQEMYGKDLSSLEKQKCINRINMILSSQANWSVKDKAVEIAHLIMLSGLPTHEKNVLANIGMLPQAALSRKISALGQKAYSIFDKDYVPTQALIVKKDAKNLARQAVEAKGGIGALTEDVVDKFSGKYADQIGAKYMFGTGKKNVVSKANDFLTSKIPVLEKVENKVGEAGNKFLKKIGSEDAYAAMDSDISSLENFRQLIYGSLSGLEDNPFVKKNFEDRLASYIQAQGIKDINDIPPEAYDLARSEALRATFKDDNLITEQFKNLHKIPIVGEVLAPFPKTTANLAVRSFDYSPAGLVRDIYANVIVPALQKYAPSFNAHSKYTKATVGEAFDEIAKGLSGTLFGGLALGLYSSGIFTGKENEDRDIANYMKGEGWKPYSVSTKGIADLVSKITGKEIDLGDNYIPYSWLQPATTNMIAMQELYDELMDGKKISDKTLDDIFARVKSIGGSYVNSMLEQSTLQSIANLFDTSYGRQGAGENFIDQVVQMPTRYFSGAVNDISKLVDDTKRDYYSNGKPLETAMGLAISRTPWASKILPAQYDLFGNEVTRNQSKAGQFFNTTLNPTGSSYRNPDERFDYIDALNAETQTGDYIPADIGRKIKLDDESELKLDNTQHSRAAYVSGQERGRLINNARENEEYMSLSADEKAYVLGELENVALAKGKQAVVSNPKITKDDAKLMDMTDDERISFLADKAKTATLKSELEASGYPSSDFFIKAKQNGEDISSWEGYQQALDENGLTDNEDYRNAYKEKGVEGLNDEVKYQKALEEYGLTNTQDNREYYNKGNLAYRAEYVNTWKEHGVENYDSESAKAAYRSKDYDLYSDYRKWLKDNEITDSTDNWEGYKKYTKEVEEELPVLKEYGMSNNIASVVRYNDAKANAAKGNYKKPSPETFAVTFTSIDQPGSDGKPSGDLSQKEIIAYLNDCNITSEKKGREIWDIYLTNPTDNYIPVLEKGEWKTKKVSKKK